MSSVTLRHAQLSRRRRHVVIFGGIIGFGALSIVLFGFAADRWLAIGEIDVRGVTASQFDVMQIARSSIDNNIPFRRNIVAFNADALEHALLQQFPTLSDIRISRNFFARRLTLIPTERNIWAAWCANARCFYIDAEGFAFAPAPLLSGNLTLMIDDFHATTSAMGRAVSSPMIKLIHAFIEALRGTDTSIPRMEISPEGELTFITNTGWKILLNQTSDPLLAASNFRALLAGPLKNTQPIDYVDLRLSDKAFYKLR